MSPHRQGLDIFTVYLRPRDYPDHIVVRKYTSYAGVVHVTKAPECQYPASEESLAKVHAGLAAMGLTRLQPMEGDDPTIESTWL